MLTIDGVRYKSIQQASKSTGLSAVKLKRDYFTSGKGEVNGMLVVFDDAADVDIREWITVNYEELMETTKKYYSFDEDLFQNCIIYLINRVEEGKVKNYAQAFYNRYRGAVLDETRKKANVAKAKAIQGYSDFDIEEVENYHSYKTKLIVENELVVLNPLTGESESILEGAQEDIWTPLVVDEAVSIRKSNQVIVVVEAVRKQFGKRVADFYFDVISRKSDVSLASIGASYGFEGKKSVSIKKDITKFLSNEDVVNSIKLAFKGREEKSFDDYTLNDF